MAAQLELVKRGDFTTDQDVLDLLGYTDGFNLAMAGWDPELSDESAPVSEAISLRTRSTSDNNLAAIFQALREKRREVEFYKSGFDKYGIWLRAQLSGETYARQALIERLEYSLGGLYRPNRDDLENFTLGVDRYAWEDTNDTDFNGSNVSLTGGTFNFANAGGDMPARLAQVAFTGVSGGGGVNHQFWLGFRTGRFGTAANFQTYWSCRKLTASDTDTTGGTSHYDATAKDNYKAVCTFATDETLKHRLTITCDDVTSYPDDQRGQYIALLRAKLTATPSTIRARLLSGYYPGNYKTGNRVLIQTTDWCLYNMGIVTIPPNALLGGIEYLDKYALRIEAERISGSSYLDLDCIILIPIAEGYVYGSCTGGNGPYYYDSYGHPLVIYQRANGKLDAVLYAAAGTPAALETPVVSGGLPVGSGIGVLAGAQAIYGKSTKTDYINVGLSVYQRWEYLRGSDT